MIERISAGQRLAVPRVARYWPADSNMRLAAASRVRSSAVGHRCWMGVSRARGGLDLGAGPVSVALAILIIGFVTYLSLNPTDPDNPSKQDAEESPRHQPRS